MLESGKGWNGGFMIQSRMMEPTKNGSMFWMCCIRVWTTYLVLKTVIWKICPSWVEIPKVQAGHSQGSRWKFPRFKVENSSFQAPFVGSLSRGSCSFMTSQPTGLRSRSFRIYVYLTSLYLGTIQNSSSSTPQNHWENPRSVQFIMIWGYSRPGHLKPPTLVLMSKILCPHHRSISTFHFWDLLSR